MTGILSRIQAVCLSTALQAEAVAHHWNFSAHLSGGCYTHELMTEGTVSLALCYKLANWQGAVHPGVRRTEPEEIHLIWFSAASSALYTQQEAEKASRILRIQERTLHFPILHANLEVSERKVREHGQYRVRWLLGIYGSFQQFIGPVQLDLKYCGLQNVCLL